ncbi:low temperature requirement protein A [soil metagenome]
MPHEVRRHSEDGEEFNADSLELFFDLVYVFAITQLSHLLLSHLSWEGAGQSALVLLVVWWAWQFTTWATNELNPNALAVRLMLIALMFASLLMSIAIPEAFGERSLLFAASYVAIQFGRQTFLTFYAAGPGTRERARASRILIWFGVSGVLWIAGGLADGELKTLLWVIALLIDYGGPLITFKVPGLPQVGAEAWDVATGHFAERFGLFVIIALGESIVITGATTSELELDPPTVAAFAFAFAGAAALWWLYFSTVAVLSARALARSERTVVMARDTYTYGHAALIAGIVLSAVGDEIVIAHPSEPLATPELLVVVAGPVVYLLTQLLLRLRNSGDISARRSLGIAGCLVVGAIGAADAPALLVGGLLTGVLIAVVVADMTYGAASKRARDRRAAEDAAEAG